MISPPRLLTCVVTLALVWLAPAAHGHALDPDYLQLTVDGDAVRIMWKVPLARAPGRTPAERPALPAACVVDPAISAHAGGASVIYRWRASCPPPAWHRPELVLPGQATSPASALVSIRIAGEATRHGVLAPGQTRLTLAAESKTGWLSFALAGAQHLLGGIDHLAFLGLLLLLPRTGSRAVVSGLSGFTLGHSITLALVAFGWMGAPAATEALIGLSVLFMAIEVARARRRQTLGMRFPLFIFCLVGLLHGMGFAEVFAGGSQRPSLTSLLAFNAGIEVAQLVVAAAVLGIVTALPRAWLRPLGSTALCALGGLGACWSLERGSALLGVV